MDTLTALAERIKNTVEATQKRVQAKSALEDQAYVKVCENCTEACPGYDQECSTFKDILETIEEEEQAKRCKCGCGLPGYSNWGGCYSPEHAEKAFM